MSEQNTEAVQPPPPPVVEPMKVDTVVYDSVEKGSNTDGYETADVKPSESN